MANPAICIENIYKEYKLGVISHGTLYRDMQSWWAKVRGKEDPNSLISLHHGQETERDSFLALNDISFEVKEGDRVGIIGKNGAGKSTLLKILSRITSPTRGNITIRGRVGSLLEVGTGFHVELTGRENIFLNGSILGMNRHEISRKLDEIVDFAGIEKHIDTPVKRYSSGMMVRLGFAVAAHLDTDILIADEVLAVGDAEFQKKALGKMRDLSTDEGRTVLFVSHNMASVQQLCGKGLILSKGKVIFYGNCTEAVNKYINNPERIINYQDDGFIYLEDYREKKYLEKVFKRIRISDQNNESRDSFPMLDPINIEIELEKTERYPEADFCIAIINQNGQWLMSFATWMYNTKKRPPQKIKLNIPTIKFPPGSYMIYLSMTDHLGGKYIDRIEHATTFHIYSADIFGTGREYTVSEGIIIPEGDLVLYD